MKTKEQIQEKLQQKEGIKIFYFNEWRNQPKPSRSSKDYRYYCEYAEVVDILKWVLE